MTDPLPMSADEPLPGLGEPPAHVTELEDQVRRSLRFMREHELVDERHAGLMQLALTLSRSIRPNEKAYGVAQCAAQLLAVFDKLLPDVDGGETSVGVELRAYLAGLGDGRGTSEVRDSG